MFVNIEKINNFIKNESNKINLKSHKLVNKQVNKIFDEELKDKILYSNKLTIRKRNGNPRRLKDFIRKTYTVNSKYTYYNEKEQTFTFSLMYINYGEGCIITKKLSEYGITWVVDTSDFVNYIQINN